MCFLIRKFMFTDRQCGAVWVTLTFRKKHKGVEGKSPPKAGLLWGSLGPMGREEKIHGVCEVLAASSPW